MVNHTLELQKPDCTYSATLTAIPFQVQATNKETTQLCCEYRNSGIQDNWTPVWDRKFRDVNLQIFLSETGKHCTIKLLLLRLPHTVDKIRRIRCSG